MPGKSISNQLSSLDKFLAKFETQHAKSNIMDPSGPPPTPISTGCLTLDYALGVGGLVPGRLTEFWGREQTGKSTMYTIAAAAYQKAVPDKMVGWIDAEATFDLEYARSLGLDLDPTRLLIVQPGNAEEVADIIKDLIISDMVGFAILDSIGAMIPQAEIEKDADEATMALVAKIVTRMTKIAAAELRPRGAMVGVINQVRANLAYGADITRTGGFALQHVTTHRVKFSRTPEKPIMQGSRADGTEEQVGIEIAMKVEKNKVAPPGRTAKAWLFNQFTEQYGPPGIDRVADAWGVGRVSGVIERAGSIYTLPDGTKHKGEDATKEYLRATPSAIEAIREKAIATRAHEVITNPLKEG